MSFSDRVLAGEGRIADDHVETAPPEDFGELEFPMKGRDALGSERAHDPLDFVVGLKIGDVLDELA